METKEYVIEQIVLIIDFINIGTGAVIVIINYAVGT